jgi:acetyl-CoA acyltransferase
MNVYIAGIAMTALGKLPDWSVKRLARVAVGSALDDAGCDLSEIEAVWFSNVRQGQMEGQNSIRGQAALFALDLHGVPVFNVENACASSSSGVLQAYAAIRAGLCEVALVVGAEKMFFPERKTEMLRAFLGGTDVHELELTRERLAKLGAGVAPPGVVLPDLAPSDAQSFFMDVYAAIARAHMRAHGTTVEQIAEAAAKNHWHSTLNPLAQYRHDMSVEQVLADRPIAWPLTRAMCAPLSDGAAAAVLCAGSRLPRLRRAGRAVRILGIGASSATHRAADDFAQHMTRLAARRAYEMAGLGPDSISLAEVHDASSFAELLQIENLGLCGVGEGGPFTASGATTLGGRVPVNPSGGLVSKGHPIAATGLIQLHELCVQLRGEAGRRQVPNARIGVAENGGGFVGVEEAACVVTVLGQ